MLTLHDHGREPADLGTSGFRHQVGRELLQLCQQQGDLALVEDGIEVGAESGKHRKTPQDRDR